MRAGGFEINFDSRQFWRDGREIYLSRLEFDLLAFLIKNRGSTITHLKLLRGVWKRNFGYDPGYLRAYINALRGKIERNPAHPEFVLTERWVGYRFHDPARPMSSHLDSDRPGA